MNRTPPSRAITLGRPDGPFFREGSPIGAAPIVYVLPIRFTFATLLVFFRFERHETRAANSTLDESIAGRLIQTCPRGTLLCAVRTLNFVSKGVLSQRIFSDKPDENICDLIPAPTTVVLGGFWRQVGEEIPCPHLKDPAAPAPIVQRGFWNGLFGNFAGHLQTSCPRGTYHVGAGGASQSPTLSGLVFVAQSLPASLRVLASPQ
jgi:hypothetical protein